MCSKACFTAATFGAHRIENGCSALPGACEYDPQQPTVALDFDGVLAVYDGYKGANVMGEPVEGIAKFLEQLRAQGFNLIVHSTRPGWRLLFWAETHQLDGYFCGYNMNPGFPHDYQRSGKPIAHAYVDDRAVPHTGDLGATLLGVKLMCKDFEPCMPIEDDDE